MTQHPILILGGTGTVGGRVTALLRAQGTPVRTVSRSTEPSFDWTDRTTWDPVLDGVKAVFIVPLDGETLTRPLVERAVELGVERVVLLSGRGVDVPGYMGGADSTQGRTHIGGETAVRASGAAWTILRPSWFAQNFSEGFFRDAVLSGEVRLPAEDGAVSFVDADDIAAVGAAALTEEGHAGRTYELSGPRALTLGEAAAEISQATGRTIRYVPLTPEAFVAELIEQGWPRTDAQDYDLAISVIRTGMDAHLSDGVQQALGREPRDFTDYVKTAAATGAWDA